MPVTLAQAAPLLGVSVETLRRWVREGGCPATAGGRGKGKGSRVDPAVVRAWRAANTAPSGQIPMGDIAGIALDFWRRGQQPGDLGQRVLGIADQKAAALLCFFIEYLAVRLKVEPPSTGLLAAIAQQGLRNGHGLTDSV